MNFRLLGWASLFVFLAVAACGPPEVHDINGGSTADDDDDVGTGDDDDDAATTLPTATTPPGGAPTLTNVPSFATWDATIRPLGCGPGQCHVGGSGGLYMSPNDAANKKYYWFSALCNRDTGTPNEGTQVYVPAAGRWPQYMRGGEAAGHAAINNNAAAVDAWLQQGNGTTPPSCNDYYDLANSS